jgi:hypothetical protein
VEKIQYSGKEDEMNGHDIAERARLLSHRRYAEVIDSNPDLIMQAREAIAVSISHGGGTMGQDLWGLVLRRTWPEIRKRMLADDAEGRLLRSNSPFSTLIGVRIPRKERGLWRQAKQELSVPTT